MTRLELVASSRNSDEAVAAAHILSAMASLKEAQLGKASESWDSAYACASSFQICLGLLGISKALQKIRQEPILMEILQDYCKTGAELAEAKGGSWMAYFDDAYVQLLLAEREDLAQQLAYFFSLTMDRDPRSSTTTTPALLAERTITLLESWLEGRFFQYHSNSDVEKIRNYLKNFGQACNR